MYHGVPSPLREPVSGAYALTPRKLSRGSNPLSRCAVLSITIRQPEVANDQISALHEFIINIYLAPQGAEPHRYFSDGELDNDRLRY